MKLSKKKLMFVGASFWGIVLILILWLSFHKSTPKGDTIDSIINGDAISDDKYPKEVKLDDFHIYPPTPTFDNQKDNILNNFYNETIDINRKQVKDIIMKQKLFNNDEEIILDAFNQINVN